MFYADFRSLHVRMHNQNRFYELYGEHAVPEGPSRGRLEDELICDQYPSIPEQRKHH